MIVSTVFIPDAVLGAEMHTISVINGRKGSHFPMPAKRDMRESLRDESREWLRLVIRKTGLTANAIAKKANVNASNLHKLLREEDWPHALSDTTKRKISAATGIPVPGGIPGRDLPGGFMEAEITPFDSQQADALPRDGKNGADWWRVHSRLLDLEGFLPGDAVLVDLNETPRAGDIVVAQVSAGDGSNVETVFRKYEPPFLTCRTTQPRYPRPELVDGDRVIIMGVVTKLYRERAHHAAA
jgi:SOS-response transcriptional repressor LexA